MTEEKVKNIDEITKSTKGNPVNENRLAGGTVNREYNQFRGPFTLMRHFAEDMENMFADFGFDDRLPKPTFFALDQPLFETPDFLSSFSPPVEMFEADGKFVVRADLPGLQKEDITVEIRGNRLLIEGERKLESEIQREGFYQSEREFGTFHRSLVLPETADPKDAKATFKNGVLEVSLAAPALASSRTRLKIEEEEPLAKTASSG